jgi:hypothetical protein
MMTYLSFARALDGVSALIPQVALSHSEKSDGSELGKTRRGSASWKGQYMMLLAVAAADNDGRRVRGTNGRALESSKFAKPKRSWGSFGCILPLPCPGPSLFFSTTTTTNASSLRQPTTQVPFHTTISTRSDFRRHHRKKKCRFCPASSTTSRTLPSKQTRPPNAFQRASSARGTPLKVRSTTSSSLIVALTLVITGILNPNRAYQYPLSLSYIAAAG